MDSSYYIIIPVVIVMIIFIFILNAYTSLEIMLFILFIMIISFIGAQYFFGVNLTATIQNFFNTPEVNVAIVQSDTTGLGNLDTTKQTFHVQGQFDYMNAKALCKAYDGKLATIQQVTDAYDKGAEWCDYGWSDGNMVLYPTQYKTWKTLQELGKREECGRPGVNGGYNNNLLQRLGVNCFGQKPKLNGPMPTKTIPQNIIDKRVEYWEKKLPNFTISPFNYESWSQ